VDLVRGTPLLVQILIVYYCIGNLVRLDDQLLLGALALGVFSGAYVAEIVRAGIESVPRGQSEAARSLGMSHRQAMFHVVGPQALKNALPALTGQFINLIKDSSLLSVIGFTELTKRGEQVYTSTWATFEVFLPVAGLYLLLTLPLTKYTDRLERRLAGRVRGHRI
jgi:polar amino acid transport system permease protein